MITAIIRKELRENYRLALAGVAVFAILIKANFDRSEPMMVYEGFEISAAFFCGIFGALLGWLQIRQERNPDLRAFLIHRPLSRTGIFFGKVIAGLTCYFIAAGLPMAGLLAAVLAPNEVAAPFDWAMTLPAAFTFLAGILCYFGGMLAARQPQARWAIGGSMTLGPGLLAMFFQFGEFWQGVIFVAIAALVLGTAAWGNFAYGGNSRRGVLAADIALPFALMPGAVMVVIICAVIFVEFVIRPKEHPLYPQSTGYQALAEGTIVKLTTRNTGTTILTDTNGQLLKDSKTGGYINVAELNQIAAPGTPSISLLDSQLNYGMTFRDSLRFCQIVYGGGQISWFYSFTRGRLLGYQDLSHQFLGSIGPDGFSTNMVTGDGRFLARNYTDFNQGHGALADSHVVIRLNFPTNAGIPDVKRVFTAPPNDSIVATAEVTSNILVQNLNVVNLNGFQNSVAPVLASMSVATAVVTSQSVYVISQDGRLMWKVRRPADFSNHATLRVFLTHAPDQCVLMVAPSDSENRKANGKLPTHFEFYDTNSTLAKTVDLPTYIAPDQEPSLEQTITGILMPRIGLVLLRPSVFFNLTASMLIAVLCAVVAFGLGWRARLSARARVGWVIFHLLTGAGGLLTFICLHRLPARERCPSCGKLRVVFRDHCEHCDASFAPAPKNGVEIFEPLEVGN